MTTELIARPRERRAATARLGGHLLDALISVLRAGGSIGRSDARVFRQCGRTRMRAAQWIGADDEPIATLTLNALLGRNLLEVSFDSGRRRFELTPAGALLAYREWEQRHADAAPPLQPIFY